MKSFCETDGLQCGHQCHPKCQDKKREEKFVLVQQDNEKEKKTIEIVKTFTLFHVSFFLLNAFVTLEIWDKITVLR